MSELIVNSIVQIAVAIIAAIVIVVGWRVVHRQEMQRDRDSKRRDLRIGYLIDAYRRLEYVSNRPISLEMTPDFEKAIADIQLFGTSKQVELAQTFAVEFAENGVAQLDPLLSELRQDLRAELDLDTVSPRIKYLRMAFDNLEKKQKNVVGDYEQPPHQMVHVHQRLPPPPQPRTDWKQARHANDFALAYHRTQIGTRARHPNCVF
jgi:hypothetical protein